MDTRVFLSLVEPEIDSPNYLHTKVEHITDL